MASAYSYRCREYLGMAGCPGFFVAETKEELWKLFELHAKEAHKEEPEKWSSDERRLVDELIKEI
jgi:hypothetical protein